MKKSINGRSWLCCVVMALLAVNGAAQVTIDKRITIQPIYVSNGSVAANPGQILYEAETDRIWAQAGIDIQFLAPVTYVNSTYMNVSANAVNPNSLLSLYQTSGQSWSVPASGGSVSANIIRLFFVQTIDSDANILGFTPQTNVTEGFFPAGSYVANTNGYTMAIADNAFNLNRLDVIAHELGHALGLDHDVFGAGTSASSSPYSSINNQASLNLMSSGTTRASPTFLSDIYPNGADKDQMTGSVTTNNWSSVSVGSLMWNPNLGSVYQIDTVRMSPTAATISSYVYSYAIPEPSTTAAIAGSAVLLVAGFFRRQRIKSSKA